MGYENLVDESIESMDKDPIKIKNRGELFRKSMLSFVESQTMGISLDNEDLTTIKQKMLELVDFNDLPFRDLLSLYRTIAEKSTQKLDVLLSLFKNQTQGNVGLLNPVKDDEIENDKLANLSSKDLQAFTEIYQLIEVVLQQKNIDKDDE